MPRCAKEYGASNATFRCLSIDQQKKLKVCFLALIRGRMQSTVMSRLYATVCERVRCFKCNLRMKHRRSFGYVLVNFARVCTCRGNTVSG